MRRRVGEERCGCARVRGCVRERGFARPVRERVLTERDDKMVEPETGPECVRSRAPEHPARASKEVRERTKRTCAWAISWPISDLPGNLEISRNFRWTNFETVSPWDTISHGRVQCTHPPSSRLPNTSRSALSPARSHNECHTPQSEAPQHVALCSLPARSHDECHTPPIQGSPSCHTQGCWLRQRSA